MRRLILAAASVLALSGVVACSREEATEPASAPAAAAEGVRAFPVGAIQVFALQDGGLELPNDNKVFGVGRSSKDVAEVLQAAGLPTDKIKGSLQGLLVRAGDRVVLIDAGAGSTFGPSAGGLSKRLQAAGVMPGQVTDVVISHSHGDHVGGLVGDKGALVYPNATIRMAAAEWAFMKRTADVAPIAQAIAAKVQTFEPGFEVAPGVKTFAIKGHTPGHVGVKIADGGATLVYIADTVHHPVISFAHPEWVMGFDTDKTQGEKSRAELLGELADENALVATPHLPFPGVGRVRRDGEAFRWEPVS